MSKRKGLGVLAGLLLLMTACTDANLRGIPVGPRTRDDKLRISGTFCTEDPSTLLFPVRVLLIVDCSESMLVTDPLDPITGMPMREQAARDAVDVLLENEDGGVAIAAIRFSAEAQVITFADQNGNGVHDEDEGYFTRSRMQLLGDGGITSEGVLEAFRETDRTSSFINALAVAYTTLRDEMDRSEEASLPLSKYVVIFISDFLPDVEGDEVDENTTERILESVDTLIDLAQLFRVGHMEMDFAYISTAREDVDQQAEDLGRQMAVHGNGMFRSFPNNESLNFLFVDLSALRRVFTLRSMVAVNTSTVSRGIGFCGNGIDEHLVTCPVEFDQIEAGTCCQPPDGNAPATWTLGERRMCCDRDLDGFESPWCGGGDCDDWDNQNFPGATRFLPDSDYDGVSDEDEFRIMSNPRVADSDGDGFGDLLEFRFRTSGLDPLDPFDSDCLAGEVAVGSTVCNDDLDNDGDGSFVDTDSDGRIDQKNNVDGTDPGCMSAFDDDETNGTVVPECVDGVDNDADGWIDAEDPDCQAGNAEAGYHQWAQCNDGEDNDGDGLIDRDDDGCASAMDDMERGVAFPYCRDGIDNDLDGWTDAADPDCIVQEQLRDTDGDGLGNCEERFFGTSRSGADTDVDSLPDPVEIRFNTSAVNDDLLDDYDRDHTPNGSEVRLGTDPRFNDAGGRARNSYRYTVNELGITRRASEIGGYARTACNDGIDNDGDGLIDSEDLECQSSLQRTEEPITEPTCLDGIDNDNDGWIDLLDAGCLENKPEVSLGGYACNDGEDNNLDGLTDAEDLDCLTGFQATEEPILEETCNDGLDTDSDGWIDSLDPDCALGRRESGRTEYLCNNGRDDDAYHGLEEDEEAEALADGLADAADPDCRNGFQNTEFPIDEPTCLDGIDNDGDGWIDELDPSCADNRPEYATNQECNDGVDNDGDGLVDADDGDCLVAVGGREARAVERNCTDGEDNDGDGWIDDQDSECISPGSRSCYDFSIDNITLAQTLDNGWNRILIYAGQVPFDDPEAYARFLVACVEARYVCSLDPELAAIGECNDNFKEPPSGHYLVDPEQFVPLADFDPRLHCQDVWEGI